VDVRAERDAVVVDAAQLRLGRGLGAGPAALARVLVREHADNLTDAVLKPESEAEHLVAAAVGEDWPRAAHELLSAAKVGHRGGLDKMIRRDADRARQPMRYTGVWSAWARREPATPGAPPGPSRLTRRPRARPVSDPLFSLVVPAYNEESRLPATLSRISDAL